MPARRLTDSSPRLTLTLTRADVAPRRRVLAPAFAAAGLRFEVHNTARNGGFEGNTQLLCAGDAVDFADFAIAYFPFVTPEPRALGDFARRALNTRAPPPPPATATAASRGGGGASTGGEQRRIRLGPVIPSLPCLELERSQRHVLLSLQARDPLHRGCRRRGAPARRRRGTGPASLRRHRCGRQRLLPGPRGKLMCAGPPLESLDA